MTQHPPKLLTEAEAAHYLGKTTEALRAMRRRGTAPRNTRVGVQVRYAWAHIQAYLKERQE